MTAERKALGGEEPGKIRYVPIPEDYEPFVGAETIERVLRKAERMRDMRVVHVNSTYYGAGAGTSLAHPHSQIMATVAVPPEVRRREGRARRYFEREGRSLFADLLAFERVDRRRMVEENEHFAAFVPFAAEVPCEIWILPKRQVLTSPTSRRERRAPSRRSCGAACGAWSAGSAIPATATC